MKKYLIIFLFMMFVLVGCTKPVVTQEPEIDEVKVSEVFDSIDIMYSDLENLNFSKEDTVSEIDRIKTLYQELNEDEKALVTNYSDFEEIVTLYKQYLEQKAQEEAEKAKVEAAVAEAIALAEAAIPGTSYGEKLELPNSYTSEDGIEVYIGWATTDPYTINTNGVVTQPRNVATRVTLTAVCRSGNVSQTINKRVAVGHLAYTELPEKPVFAYYYSNQRSLTEMERQTINVINLSFGGIDNDGNVYVNGLKHETVLQERKYGIRVCFSVQVKEGFVKWTATPEKREKLAQSFVDVVEEYHFDGVDIDWEYPEGGDQINGYVEFMKLLYSKMKKASPKYLVTSAMYGGNGVSKYNAGESYKYMDYIHLMTYDLNSADRCQHLTALGASSNGYSSVEQTVAYYLGAGIPKEKLVIGAAMYGKVYEISKTATKFIGEKPLIAPYSILYREIRNEYLSKLDGSSSRVKVEEKWDETAKAPYLCVTEYNTNGEITAKKFITYDNARSMTLKSEYVFANDLGGLMFWELGYEDRQTNDLVKAIHDVFYK